jgi:hypothetical protein
MRQLSRLDEADSHKRGTAKKPPELPLIRARGKARATGTLTAEGCLAKRGPRSNGF